MSNQQNELWSITTVCAKTGMGKTFIYREMKDDRFPKNIPIGRSKRWPSNAVQAWIDQQIRAASGIPVDGSKDGLKS